MAAGIEGEGAVEEQATEEGQSNFTIFFEHSDRVTAINVPDFLDDVRSFFQDKFPTVIKLLSKHEEYPEPIRLVVSVISRVITLALALVLSPFTLPYAFHVLLFSALRQSERILLESIPEYKEIFFQNVEEVTTQQNMDDKMSEISLDAGIRDIELQAAMELSFVDKASLVWLTSQSLFKATPLNDVNQVWFYTQQTLNGLKLWATFALLSFPLVLVERVLSVVTFLIGAVAALILGLMKLASAFVLVLPLYFGQALFPQTEVAQTPKFLGELSDWDESQLHTPAALQDLMDESTEETGEESPDEQMSMRASA